MMSRAKPRALTTEPWPRPSRGEFAKWALANGGIDDNPWRLRGIVARRDIPSVKRLRGVLGVAEPRDRNSLRAA